MKILCWNIVSLRAILQKKNIIDNKEKIKNTFENFIKNNDFDIICLQEIKLCNNSINILLELLPEYEYKYYNIPKSKKGYSGVAIISKIKPAIIPESFVFPPALMFTTVLIVAPAPGIPPKIAAILFPIPWNEMGGVRLLIT